MPGFSGPGVSCCLSSNHRTIRGFGIHFRKRCGQNADFLRVLPAMFRRSTPLGTVANLYRLSCCWSRGVCRRAPNVCRRASNVCRRAFTYSHGDSPRPKWIHLGPWGARHRLGAPGLCTSPARDAWFVHVTGSASLVCALPTLRVDRSSSP